MNELNIKAEQKIDSVEDFKFEPIKDIRCCIGEANDHLKRHNSIRRN